MEKKVTKGELTRQKLLERAIVSFSKKGYESTSVDELVESIGLTSGVFYANFKSKKDLLNKALAAQINISKKYLLSQKPNETNMEWAKRAVSIYLSPQHRDHIDNSCPLTTLSQELLKLKLLKATGLTEYAAEFRDTLSERLNGLSPGKGILAGPIISLCIGAIISARMETEISKSDEILTQAKKTIFKLIDSEA